MKLDLINNNTTGNLIAFVQMGDQRHYCLAEVEYWIAEWWNGYVNLEEGSLETLYFNYLNRFKVEEGELRTAYKELIELGNQFKLDGNKPTLFIDFDKKEYISSFYDQALEKRLPKDWSGRFGAIDNLIAEEHKYWEELESA